MLPDSIDDLFRQQLGGHATPPPDDLWQRLALPAAEAEPVDAVFQEGLRGHATPPRRELWERLEDEHLRPQPRRRRVVAWWHYSAAAVLLVTLLAGGGLLWRNGYQRATGGEVARLKSGKGRNEARSVSASTTAKISYAQAQPTIRLQDLATATTSETGNHEKKQKSLPAQATASLASTSSTPIATTTRPRRAATAGQAAGSHHQQRQQPDAAFGTLAASGGRNTPAGQPLTTPSVAPAGRPAEVVPTLAATTGPVVPAAMPEIIEVEVRRGAAARTTAPAVVAATETSPAPARRRGLHLGGLLRQADHLVHGEPVSLAEATGLPQNVTVQARLGGRLLSKTIQL